MGTRDLVLWYLMCRLPIAKFYVIGGSQIRLKNITFLASKKISQNSKSLNNFQNPENWNFLDFKNIRTWNVFLIEGIIEIKNQISNFVIHRLEFSIFFPNSREHEHVPNFPK